MDVRVLITQILERYRVRVFAPGPPCRIWVKDYDSKAHCLAELAYVGLATPSEIDDALQAGINTSIAALAIRAHVEPSVLNATGFVEQVNSYVN